MTNLRMLIYLKALLTPTYGKRLKDNVKRMGEDKWPKMARNYKSTERTVRIKIQRRWKEGLEADTGSMSYNQCKQEVYYYIWSI
jgi:hypothetical protein